MAPSKKLPPIHNRAQPAQARSSDTFELIVLSTAQIVQEIGFDKLSTNRICDRAGLTPPALYRYFPNKYAILRELGERLMKIQDDVVFNWSTDADLGSSPIDEQIAYNFELNTRVVEATRNFPGSVGIMRALRAIPALRSTRLESRERVVEALTADLRRTYRHVPLDRLRAACRLTTEWGHATIEMAVEEPEQNQDQILLELARAVVIYYRSLADVPS